MASNLVSADIFDVIHFRFGELFISVAWISITMNSEGFVEFLENSLIGNEKNRMGPDLNFHKDNAAVHKSRLVCVQEHTSSG